MSRETLIENLRRIELMQMLGNAGICDERNGIVIEPCPMYAVDCPRTCTYAMVYAKRLYNEPEDLK